MLSREPAGRSASSASPAAQADHADRRSTFKPIEDEVDDDDFAEAVTA
jgi:hypothetical protein